MSEHTPGPVTIHSGHDVTGYPCYFINGVAGAEKHNFTRINATARFIETAYNSHEALLAACKAAIVTYEHAVCDNCGIYGAGCGDCHHTDQFKAMRAAIAKADQPKGKP